MKRVFGFLILFGVIAGSGNLAAAQEPPQMPPQMPPPGAGQGGQGGPGNFRMQMPNFADLDKNNDKKISKEEFPMPPQFFERLDENKDGVIDEEEFGRARGRMAGGGGGGPRLSETLGKLMDANQDAKVSREEFARINQVFDALDKDRNGELTTDELNRFFEAVREVQNQATGGVDVQGLFTQNDKNKDGVITAEEMGKEREFKALDLNKDGSLTRQEAEEGLKRLELARQKKQAATPAPNK
jgi:Ca2+-binding EF-hand superfamily protein